MYYHKDGIPLFCTYLIQVIGWNTTLKKWGYEVELLTFDRESNSPRYLMQIWIRKPATSVLIQEEPDINGRYKAIVDVTSVGKLNEQLIMTATKYHELYPLGGTDVLFRYNARRFAEKPQ